MCRRKLSLTPHCRVLLIIQRETWSQKSSGIFVVPLLPRMTWKTLGFIFSQHRVSPKPRLDFDKLSTSNVNINRHLQKVLNKSDSVPQSWCDESPCNQNHRRVRPPSALTVVFSFKCRQHFRDLRGWTRWAGLDGKWGKIFSCPRTHFFFFFVFLNSTLGFCTKKAVRARSQG